ncbi:hypothetical protein K4Q65_09710 [Staphylococcus epidermidis]|nr:hypothetical protein [Staphylococcus epidermidis]
MKKRSKKDRTIAVRVTALQHKKIDQLASVRHMNIADYIRSTALGNRIKPTVIQKVEKPIIQNDSNDSYEINEQLRKDNEALKRDNEALKRDNEELKRDNEALKRDNEELKRDNEELKKLII